MSVAPATRSRARRTALAIVHGVLVTGFLSLAIALDVFAAGRFPARMLLLVSFFALPALTVATIERRRWMYVTSLASWLLVIALLLVPWHPRKRFVRDLLSVHPGMRVDEVERVMGHYIKGAGSRWVVPAGPVPVVGESDEDRSGTTELESRVRSAQSADLEPRYPDGEERAHMNGIMTYRWNDRDAAYNSDWGQVTFVDGRVVLVEFLPD